MLPAADPSSAWLYFDQHTFPASHFGAKMSSQVLGSQERQKKSKTSKLTERERLRVVQLKSEGLTHRAIAQQIGCSNSTVSDLVKKMDEEGTIRDRKTTGRPRKTTEKDDQFIALLAKQDPCQTSKQLAETIATGSVNVSHHTVLRRLRERGLHSRIQRGKPLLTEKAAKKRLQFAKQYVSMPIDFQKKVIFSDESKFEIISNKRASRVIRFKNQAFFRRMTKKKVKHSKYGLGMFLVQRSGFACVYTRQNDCPEIH